MGRFHEELTYLHLILSSFPLLKSEKSSISHLINLSFCGGGIGHIYPFKIQKKLWNLMKNWLTSTFTFPPLPQHNRINSYLTFYLTNANLSSYGIYIGSILSLIDKKHWGIWWKFDPATPILSSSSSRKFAKSVRPIWQYDISHLCN